eukprot:m.1640373 g.1640373  ORF g.1640373 m.1640373 type:complete len:269 (+) comp41532_c0_seq1:229-1035(+)
MADEEEDRGRAPPVEQHNDPINLSEDVRHPALPTPDCSLAVRKLLKAMEQLALHEVDSVDRTALNQVQTQYLEKANYIPQWARDVLATVVKVAEISATERDRFLGKLEDPISPSTQYFHIDDRHKLATLSTKFFQSPGRRFDFFPSEEVSSVGGVSWPPIVSGEDVFFNPIRRRLRADVLNFLRQNLLVDLESYEIRVQPGDKPICVAVASKDTATMVHGKLAQLAQSSTMGFFAPGDVIGVDVDPTVELDLVSHGPLLTTLNRTMVH